MSLKMGNYVYKICVQRFFLQFNSITVFKRKGGGGVGREKEQKEQKTLQHYYVLNVEKVQPCMN